MLRIVIVLCSFTCLALAAPTVHLFQPSPDGYEDNTELPLIIEPVAVTMNPLVETSYVDPVNVNYYQPMATANQQPVQQQPSYYYPPTYLNTYNLPGYQQQPSYDYQWQGLQPIPRQQPMFQPPNTNVLPWSQTRHVGGYQQHGY
ncbi:uncharacterized protein LOC135702290 [Ochlerotatus camptorhynchus]|uniref:uncharacterized protein LOC135702290 n=1 Tax=Ochlerotatus camptorhynchus TaxID=644619 RepID=UPI0031E05315